MTDTRKIETLVVRMRPEVMRNIDRAARLGGLSKAAFVRVAALRESRRELAAARGAAA